MQEAAEEEVVETKVSEGRNVSPPLAPFSRKSNSPPVQFGTQTIGFSPLPLSRPKVSIPLKSTSPMSPSVGSGSPPQQYLTSTQHSPFKQSRGTSPYAAEQDLQHLAVPLETNAFKTLGARRGSAAEITEIVEEIKGNPKRPRKAPVVNLPQEIVVNENKKGHLNIPSSFQDDNGTIVKLELNSNYISKIRNIEYPMMI